MNNKLGVDGELLSDKKRITPLGNFLRKTSLDELPNHDHFVDATIYQKTMLKSYQNPS